jgi:hypothetical protein
MWKADTSGNALLILFDPKIDQVEPAWLQRDAIDAYLDLFPPMFLQDWIFFGPV